MNKIQENISEIAMYVGAMIANGTINKNELDISSGYISENIVKWAEEFETKYGEYDFHSGQLLNDIGEVFGYLDAIDKFTEFKCTEIKWM